MPSPSESPDVLPPATAGASASPGGPKAASYGNFRDPVGLVWRMLSSRDSVARSALWRAILERIAVPLDHLLARLEQRRLRRAGAQMLPQFLIVGLPRSGTTLVYQTLAARLPVTYFNNLSALFPRSVMTISAAWKRSFAAPADDRSFYGHTEGLNGVNEGLHVWNRWLGEDRNSAPRRLGASAVADMQRFFAAWSQSFGRPLLNKSNRNTFCIEALAHALPAAQFIVVRRDPVFVAQSLLKARKTVQGDMSVGWGLGAQREGHVPNPDPFIDVAEQVQFCDEELRAHTARLPAGRVLEIEYEEFCRDPAGHVQRVWDRLRAACPPEVALAAPRLDGLKSLADTDFATLDEQQFKRLRHLMAAQAAAGPAQ